MKSGPWSMSTNKGVVRVGLAIALIGAMIALAHINARWNDGPMLASYLLIVTGIGLVVLAVMDKA